MSLPGKQIEVNGVNYHVYDEGQGDKTALLIHGMPDTSLIWKDLAPALIKDGYRVVAPDMIGYGKSDKPQETERYAGEHVVADTLAIIDTLGLKNIDIVGHDWGAGIVWELVMLKPELFRKHVCLAVGHPQSMFAHMTMDDVKENWYMYMNTQTHAGDLYAYNDFKFLRESLFPSHPDLDEVCGRLADPKAMNGMLNWDRANQVSSFYLAYAQGDLEYDNCKVPTMGIWSKGDIYLSEKWMTKTEDLMDAEWRYECVEGSHWMMLDNSEKTCELIRDWFAK